MADHPAIVALRDLLILHSDDSKLHQARAAYAAVLRDLMHTAWADRHNVVDLIEGYGREIGVEI